VGRNDAARAGPAQLVVSPDGTMRCTVSAPSPATSRRRGRAVALYRSVRARQRRLELRLERRSPMLYDSRHAATGIGRALWPLIGPLLTLGETCPDE
jgi:hypothetical protein